MYVLRRLVGGLAAMVAVTGSIAVLGPGPAEAYWHKCYLSPAAYPDRFKIQLQFCNADSDGKPERFVNGITKGVSPGALGSFQWFYLDRAGSANPSSWDERLAEVSPGGGTHSLAWENGHWYRACGTNNNKDFYCTGWFSGMENEVTEAPR